MNKIERREWLKTIGLSGGLALMGGYPALAGSYPSGKLYDSTPVRLNANENPYGPSDAVRKALADAFGEACRYPFSALPALVVAIAQKEGVSESCVVVTGGSTEGLKATGLVYGLEGGEIVSADPTFDALLTYAEEFGAHVHRVPLNERMEHDLKAMGRKVNSKTRLIFICNPNNPSGTLLEANALTKFCLEYEKRALVFCDEAYYDYIDIPGYPSMTGLVKEGRNVVVSKTFSKVFGLAGLRIGYLLAPPEIAGKLRAATMANTNTLAIVAALEALNDRKFYKFSLLKTLEAKQLVYSTLEGLKIPYIPSHTNFVFFKSGRPIEQLRSEMRSEGVIIGRPFPPLLDWARISTGTMEDMSLFSRALGRVLGA